MDIHQIVNIVQHNLPQLAEIEVAAQQAFHGGGGIIDRIERVTIGRVRKIKNQRLQPLRREEGIGVHRARTSNRPPRFSRFSQQQQSEACPNL